jgi:hypothetical protein
MKRKCLSVLILSFVVVISGCATAWQEERQKNFVSETVSASYDYPWEQVYDAYAYVLRNSAMGPIVRRTEFEFSRVRYLSRQKKIAIIVYGTPVISSRNIELEINFMPGTDAKTKVNIVKGSTALLVYFDDQDDAVRQLLDEVNFVLKNKGEGYFEYTLENSAKWQEENRAQKRNRPHDWNNLVR